MKYGPGLLLCVFVSALLCVPGAAQPPSVGTGYVLQGGSVAPMFPQESIRMDSMHVTIRLKRKSYVVDAVFGLYNTGRTKKERVGVLKCTYGSWRYAPMIYDFIRFDGWIEGRRAEFSQTLDFFEPPIVRSMHLRGVDLAPRYIVSEVVFQGHTRTTIRIMYEAHYWRDWEGSYKKGHAHARGMYQYGTSRYWKDKIGKAVFILDYTGVGEALQYLEGPPRCPGARRLITEDVLKYEISDFEPRVRSELSFGYELPR